MKRLLILSFFLLSWMGEAEAQRPRQYKRIHQEAFKKILDGKVGKAIEQLEEFVETYPDDEESHYMLALAHARRNNQLQAIQSVRRALDAGLPAGRIVGGSLTGLEVLESEDLYQQLLSQFEDRVVHGPMLGNITGQSVQIWVRTARQATVKVVAKPEGQESPLLQSPLYYTTAQSDFTAVVTLNGLKPQTNYSYQVIVNGRCGSNLEQSFRTFPPQFQPAKFRIGFGGGAGYVPENERAWETILAQKPDVLMLLGDNVYSDDPTTQPMQHYCYYRRQSRPEFRKLVGLTPVYSIWDDHDFGTNDCSGGPMIDSPDWKRSVYEVFRNNWVNPYFGGGDGQPGCFYDFYLGDVHFIMLDGRFYRDRTPQRPARPTMLGPVQRAWLFDRIKKTKGKFLVLCSPVPWVFEAKGDSLDTWNGFQEERNSIFDLLTEKKVNGVVLISADRHRSDLWKIDRPGTYPLFEFNSSRLTNQHVHKELPQAEFSFNKKQSFGLVDFDTTLENPSVTYRIMTIDGKQVFSKTIVLSELQSKSMVPPELPKEPSR
ncbi:MAG: alkaline phosphatase D family protein [Pirellulaceae bacterium]|nr:alkaline phosphatase D family protein [Pirellulaceae bacterium]